MKFSKALGLLAALLFPSLAQAATITVTTLADNETSDGQCSLREALVNANLGSFFSDCAAGDSDTVAQDRVVFDASVVGTIVLQLNRSMPITTSVSIEGPGPDILTIDGNAQKRIFTVDSGSSVKDVAISGLSLTGGRANAESDNAGGAIFVAAQDNLTLKDMKIDGNSAELGGAIFNEGFAEIDTSELTGNRSLQGGAIANQGIAALVESAVIDNDSESGGGIYSTGRLAVFNSTIASNRSLGDGGGIVNDLLGDVILSNATVAFNRADDDADGIGSGGGIFSSSINTDDTVDLLNTLLAGNVDASAASEGPDCFGVHFKSKGHNLIQNTKGCSIADSALGDLSGVDPLLGLLADNGGPTQTILPGEGSPIIDAGASACLSDDQRGLARPADGNGDGMSVCDIGAVEAAAVVAAAGGTTGDAGADNGGTDGGKAPTGAVQGTAGDGGNAAAQAGGCSLVIR